MPKDTFHRLPEDKKLRIYHSAIQEFSARRFSDASLNQIVKTAKIPWGSFYQYFTGKEDLFLYMLGEIAKEKREVIGLSEGIEENADVFELCLRTTMATFEWSVNCAEYSRISMLMEIDNCDFVIKIRMELMAGLIEIIEKDKKRGLIKPDTDSALIADMIYSLIWKQYSIYMHDRTIYQKKLNDGFQIIKQGIMASK
jgi:AcrR family transcriptional regulator